MRADDPVTFYLDFVSPYSWLALMQAERFAEVHRIEWQIRPVVYAVLLADHGLVGPVEVEAKRRYTFHDVARCADRLDLQFNGPPEHPFRSLEALRTLQLFTDSPETLRLAVRLANICWGEGRSLTDPAVIAGVVEQVGLDPRALSERIAAEGNKQALRATTETARSRGVFGVPTFVLGRELFWGHDRLDHLARRLAGPRS